MPKCDMPNTIVKHKGLMDFPKLIETARSWLVDEGYTVDEVKHKVKKDSAGSEYEIELAAERKINEYVKYYFKLTIRAWGVRSIEVTKEGKKTKTFDGRVHLEVSPQYELDWQGRFGGSKFLQGLQDFYHKYIIYRDINDQWEDDLLLKGMQLVRTLKEVFGHEV
ncbi:MAG: hypothetical protein HY363_04270 [Candidatus Aenigmarchaeota archaeon]|nr:hypothetical protein [Candidatus Aenigmarchaeota archaeon]